MTSQPAESAAAQTSQGLSNCPTTSGDPKALAGLYTKIAKIMGEMTRLPKRGHNDFHHYAYVTQEDVYDVVRKALAENKIGFFPAMTGIELVTTNKVDKVVNKTRIYFQMTFADGESGATISLPWIAEAVDDQDKATSKASAQAEKYFLLRTFIISTGDDIDPDSEGRSKARSASGKPANQGLPGKDQAGTQSSSQANGNGNRAAADVTGATIEQVTPVKANDWTTFYTKSVPWFDAPKDVVEKSVAMSDRNAIKAFEALKAHWLEAQQIK